MNSSIFTLNDIKDLDDIEIDQENMSGIFMEQPHKKVCIRVLLHSFLWCLKTFSKTLASQILVWNCQSQLHGCWFHFIGTWQKTTEVSLIHLDWAQYFQRGLACPSIIKTTEASKSESIHLNRAQYLWRQQGFTGADSTEKATSALLIESSPWASCWQSS